MKVFEFNLENLDHSSKKDARFTSEIEKFSFFDLTDYVYMLRLYVESELESSKSTTFKQVSKNLGLSERTLSALLERKKHISLARLNKIAAVIPFNKEQRRYFIFVARSQLAHHFEDRIKAAHICQKIRKYHGPSATLEQNSNLGLDGCQFLASVERVQPHSAKLAITMALN